MQRVNSLSLTGAETPSRTEGGGSRTISFAYGRQKVDFYLLTLVVILLVINLPYWSREFMVGHDTKNTYLVFHYFYNHLYWYSELPHWLPFGEYGYNAIFYQLCDFSPSTYLAGLFGWVLGVRDSLLLFKLSVFGDQLIFLLGLHLLSRRLYDRKLAAFLVCLMGISSVIWTWQIYWCLRQFYLIPLVLYFYHRFLEDRTSWAFWAGILTLLFSLVGGLPYWAPIYTFLFIVMTVILLPSHWRSFTCLLRPGAKDLALIALTVACATAAGYVIVTCLAGLHNYAPGRSLGEMRTNLQTYLTYVTPIWGKLHSFLDGTLPERLVRLNQPEDQNLYVGLLSLAGFVVAFFRVRNVWFYSLAGGMVALALLADSGALSWLLYWLMPGLDKFRHLGLLLELAKVLLLLAGGFGVDRLLDVIGDRERLAGQFRPLLLLSMLAGLCLVLDLLVSFQAYLPVAWSSPMVLADMLPQGGSWVVIRLAVWALVLCVLFAVPRIQKLAGMLPAAVLPGLVAAACLVDMASFQGYHWTNRSTAPYVGRLDLGPLVYSDSRSREPSAAAVHKHDIIMSSPGGAYLAFYANALQHDLCVPLGRVDIFPKGVHELVTARGARPSQYAFGETFLPSDDSQLLTVLGCEVPKLRFVTQAEYGRTDEELSELIRTSKSLDTTVILRGVPDRLQAGSKTTDPVPMAYRVKAFTANRLDLDVTVKQGLSGWLVFADAFNPFWAATVNRKEAPIIEAYRAFKAVHLGEGASSVSFRFENTGQSYAMGLLIVTGIFLALGCVIGLVWQIFRGRGSAFSTRE